MPDNAELTCRISLLWSTRKKCWVIYAAGGDGRRAWTCNLDADTTVEVDRTAAWLLLQALKAEMESWLTYGPEHC